MSDNPLPAGWAWTTLRELGQWFGGGTPSKRNPEFWKAGTIPWLSPKDMGMSLLVDTQDHITEAAVVGSATSRVPANSVALVVRSGILERRVPVSLVPFATTLNQDMKAIAPHAAVDAKWLLYTLQSQEQAILHDCRKAGTTVASLDTAKLHGLPIPLPPLPEQHRIVETLEEHLSRLDAADGGLGTQLVRARKLLDRQLASSVTEAGGTAVRVGEVLSRKPANGRSVPTADVGFPVLRLTALRDGVIDLAERKIGEWTAADANRFLVNRRDILLSRGNGSLRLVGRAGIVHAEPDAVAYPDTMIRLIPEVSRVFPEYLVTLWNSRIVRSQIESAARTTAGIFKINQTIVSNILIPLPSLERQQQVVSEVKEVADAARRLTTEIEATAPRSGALRRALLRAAFEGKLVDQDPTDEPAEVALAKIRDQPVGSPTRRRRKVVAAK